MSAPDPQALESAPSASSSLPPPSIEPSSAASCEPSSAQLLFCSDLFPPHSCSVQPLHASNRMCTQPSTPSAEPYPCEQAAVFPPRLHRSEEHTSELQSLR